MLFPPAQTCIWNSDELAIVWLGDVLNYHAARNGHVVCSCAQGKGTLGDFLDTETACWIGGKFGFSF